MKDPSIFQPIVTAKLKEVGPELYKKLYQLNFRARGSMRRTMIENRKMDNAYVCYILDNNNNVAAWALVYSYCTNPSAHFYVRKRYRRHGLGTAIMEAATIVADVRYNKKINYFPHDPRSTWFFKSCREWGILNKTNDRNAGYYS